MVSARPDRATSWIAAGAALLMLAEHVAGKAVRDAFFLSTFGASSLPSMFVIAAVASVAIVPLLTRMLSAYGPARVVTPAFVISSGLMALSAWLASHMPRVAAVTLYLHVAAINAVLISWFWSLVNEHFDPRSAKREMRRMMGGAALGGLLGGLVAERAAVLADAGASLLVLAGLQACCAIAVWRLSSALPKAAARAGRSSFGFSVLRRSRYAQALALLVLLSTMSATLLDYLFKAQAVATFQGPALLRFFALFYAATGLLTFLLQSLISHVALARLGVARTIASLPAALAIGGLAALLFPGLPAFTALRSTEMSLHSSLYRSAYELFFTPMSAMDRRDLKTLIDVGFDRLGDALGGALLKLVLALAGTAAVSALLGLAVGLSLLVLLVTAQLHRSYVRALEQRLRDRAVEIEIDVPEIKDATLWSVLDALEQPEPSPAAPKQDALRPQVADPLVGRIAALRSRDLEQVRRALAEGPLSPPLIPHAIALLSWNEAAPAALSALEPCADSAAGQLGDALLSPDEEFAVRRRVPRILEMGASPRAVDALLAGLGDARFEVRYRSGRALARIQARSPDAPLERKRIFAAVLEEAAIDRGVWESQRVLDEDESDRGEHEFVDELVRDRASRSLEHVFTLLSLAFPRRPLILAFRGLHTNDDHLRGTALEYLEGILPTDVRAALWPFLEDRRPPQRSLRTREEALDQLLLSNSSIQLNLEEARRRISSDDVEVALDRHRE